MPYYDISYYYLATGMEGRADKRDYGTWYGSTKDEAMSLAIESVDGPVDEPTKSWIKDCLTAREITNPRELE